MGSVEVYTKARMQEIENTTIVDGHVDVGGHLILETREGTEIDAGNVHGEDAPNLADASTTVKGIAEIATLTEVSTGTDTTRFVTAQGVRQERDVVDTYTGVISPIWSSGKPVVTLDGGQAYSGTVTAFLPGNDDVAIAPGASVLLSRANSGVWVILTTIAGQPRYMRQIPCSLESGSGWVMYSDVITSDLNHRYGDGPAEFGAVGVTANSDRSNKFYVTVTSTGIASMEGLLVRSAGAPAVGSVIGRYPIALAPARNEIFGTNANGGIGQIAVCTDGTIRYVMGGVTFMSLNNIRWRTAASVVAGLATFVPLSLNVGWATHTTAAFTGEPGSTVHTPGYTIDADKIVIFEGLVLATVAKASGADIATLIALSLMNGTHQVAPMPLLFGFIRISQTGGAGGAGNIINTGIAVASGNWMSLSNVMRLESTSTITRIGSGSVNSWQAYNSALYAAPGFAKTPDGLVIAFGLWNQGTIGSAMTYIPDGWRPRFGMIVSTVSNSAVARIDVADTSQANYGSQAIVATSGSNVWVSLDGISWPAYR